MFWYPREKDINVADEKGQTLVDFLRRYDPKKYDLPAVTVDNLIFKKRENLQLLLIRRGRHPYIGMLGLPGGFIEKNETLEQSARRELLEETGLTNVKLRQLGAYGTPERDPRMRIISVAYLALAEPDAQATAGDDAADAGFFAVDVAIQAEGADRKYVLTFTNGAQRASATILEKGSERLIVESEVASDHALMILDGLERLGFVDNM